MDITSIDYSERPSPFDCDATDRSEKSKFLAFIALESMPAWLKNYIIECSPSMVDWGCASGEGSWILSKELKVDLCGIDSSEDMVMQARKNFPEMRFEMADWLAESAVTDSSFDIVFSSNTLQQFKNPEEVLRKLFGKARQALILLLPYRDQSLIGENLVKFTPQDILAYPVAGYRLIWSRVIDCSLIQNSKWSEEQICLIYARDDWQMLSEINLSDMELASQDFRAELLSANDRILSRDERIRDLKSELQNLKLQLRLKESDFESLKISNSQLYSRYTDTLESLSWRLTAPVRFLGLFVKSPGRAIGMLRVYLRDKSPSSLRGFINFAFSGTASSKNPHHIDEISWKEFSKNILADRSKFRGVFVQEHTIPWGASLYQRPQHMACAFGDAGYLVIYRTFLDDVQGVRKVANNVWITPREEVDSLRGAYHSFYSTSPIYTPDIVVETRARAAAVFYEYIDHIDPKISGNPQNIQKLMNLRNFAFADGFDYVVCSAKALYDEAADHLDKKKLIMVPNGVDTCHYRSHPPREYELPDNLLKFRVDHENIVGYFGAIAPWLWYGLIEELCHRRPDLGFIFIGPDYHGCISKLPDVENFLYVGAVDYQDLPIYARLFDIAFIPFEPGDIAQTTSPLKLFEYFALEKPVVCTADMIECVQFEEVFSGSSPDSFSEAIDSALARKGDSDFSRILARLADENDWRKRADTFGSLLQNLTCEEEA